MGSITWAAQKMSVDVVLGLTEWAPVFGFQTSYTRWPPCIPNSEVPYDIMLPSGVSTMWMGMMGHDTRSLHAPFFEGAAAAGTAPIPTADTTSRKAAAIIPTTLRAGRKTAW